MIAEKSLQALLNEYWSQYQKGGLTKGDIVSIFLVLYDRLYPIENWLQCSPKRKNSNKTLSSDFYPKQSPDFQSHSFFKKNSSLQSMGDIINQSQFKRETLKSTMGLVHVYVQPETVKILDYIPTPAEVLEMQSQGLRCVSLLRDENWFNYSSDHKRNIRDFILHDLEHIWQMFETPSLTESQIEFSRRLLKLKRSGQFDFLIQDSTFGKEFNYIISDMNTHPAHTYVTLKSILLRQKSKSLAEIADIMKHFESLVVHEHQGAALLDSFFRP